MIKVFRWNRRSILALELGCSLLKLVVLSSSKSRYRIEQVVIDSLSNEMMDGHQIKDVESFGLILRALLEKYGIRTQKTYLAMPDALVEKKIISVSCDFSASDIEKLIVLEQHTIFPSFTQGIQFDFRLLEPLVTNPLMREVLVVASQADHVQSRGVAIQKANLQLIALDVESEAVMRMAQWLQHAALIQREAAYAQKYVAWVHLGDLCAIAMIFQGMQLLDCQEAQSITQALNQFYIKYPQRMLDEIMLGGDKARLLDQMVFLRGCINTPITIADPSAYFEVSEQINQSWLEAISSSMWIVFGIALRKDTNNEYGF